MNLTGRYGTTRRVIRLVRMLQTRPHSLAELEAELDVGPLQIGRDLDLLREEGFVIRAQGRPAMTWVEIPVPVVNHVTRTARGAKRMQIANVKDRPQVTDADVIQMTAQQAYEEEWYGRDRGLVNGLGTTFILFDSVPGAKRTQHHVELIRWCATQGIEAIAKGRYKETLTIGFKPGAEGRLKSAQALKQKWDEIVLRDLALPQA